MVAAGATALEPVVPTLPIAWSMLTVVAPETFQLSVEVWPETMLPGFASKEFITGSCPPASSGEGASVEPDGLIVIQAELNARIVRARTNNFFIIQTSLPRVVV